jgi:hypothetical protein
MYREVPVGMLLLSTVVTAARSAQPRRGDKEGCSHDAYDDELDGLRQFRVVPDQVRVPPGSSWVRRELFKDRTQETCGVRPLSVRRFPAQPRTSLAREACASRSPSRTASNGIGSERAARLTKYTAVGGEYVANEKTHRHMWSLGFRISRTARGRRGEARMRARA